MAVSELTSEERRAILSAGRCLPPYPDLEDEPLRVYPRSKPAGDAATLDGAKPGPAFGNRDAAAGWRFRQFNQFIDATLRDLTRAELAVWLVLFRDVDAAAGLATTAQQVIGDRGGLSQRSVSQAIAGLESKGLVTVIRQGGFRRGTSVYRIHPTEGAR